MEGLSVSNDKFARKDQVNNLASSVYAAIDGKMIQIDPQLLYQRLLVAGVGTINTKTLLEFELCSYPCSLFDKSVMMRTPDKADMQNTLLKKVPQCIMEDCSNSQTCVIDGGAMLQKLPWPKSITYEQLCQLYIDYVQRHYHNAHIAFDGYEEGPSTKDETHQRRAGNEIGVDIQLTPDMLLTMKKKQFLANPKNKQQFINLLGSEMEKAMIHIKHASGHAGYDIAMSACNIALTKPVVVVGDDTDVLILLQHHFKPSLHETILLLTGSKLIDISILQNALHPDLSQSLLFIHALSGCDTTSRPHGNKALVALYSGIKDLDSERVARFADKVASRSGYLPPERLPPTSDAAQFHSQRVYLQVQTWLGVSMEPTDWGFEMCQTKNVSTLKPHNMDKDAAPPSLLKIVHRGCTGKCSKNTCTCKKNGLKCSLACSNCKGLTCLNGEPADIAD